MKRVLVTGGSGFFGANLVRRLLHDGHEVHVLLRDGQGAWRLEDIVRECRPVRGDLADPDDVARALAQSRPDWVFHLAAYGAYPAQTSFDRMVAVNILGAANLFRGCADRGVEFLVNAGSSSEYGTTTRAAREDDRLEPNSAYAVSKAAATHYCQLMARERGLRCATVRLYSVYGPWEEPTRLVPTLLVHAFHGRLPPLVSRGTARDFVYVDDAVDAMVGLARAGTTPGVWNIASGVQTTLETLVSHVRTLLGVAAEPVWGSMERRAWDTETWVGESAALRGTLGWTCAHDLAAGLRRTIDWLRADPRRLPYYESRILARR